jgi:porin
MILGKAAVAAVIGAMSIVSAAQAADVTATAADGAAPKSIWEQDTLTGDWDGARTALKNKGIDITINYIGETFAVLSGGLNRRASYEGRLEFSVDSDLEKLIGWKGASTHVTVFNIHSTGKNVAANVGSIADPSNIDALQTTRLFTAWFQQGSTDDPLSVRIGQLAADDEFITSPTAAGLINGTFGWAAVLAADMTNGGPAYPLAAPGVRVQVKPTDDITILGAVFTGDPAGAHCGDAAQVCNRYGLKMFNMDGGSLWLGELQYHLNQGKDAKGLPGIYKIGAWYATTDFADQRFPVTHSGNWGIYGVADQTVWKGAAQSVSLFVRSGASPSDRNLLSFYVDGGVGFKGLVPGRADDVLTFGVAYEKISADAAAADRDAGLPVVRNHEIVFEASYQAQLAPWWTLQPDIQYIVHPGGNVPDPLNPAVAVKDALVVGLRTAIKF